MTAPEPAPAGGEAAGKAPDAEIFRAIFDASPDALLLVDGGGLIVLANTQAAAVLGYAPAELTGLPVDALVPPALRPQHAQSRQSYRDAPRVRPMGAQAELCAQRKDGVQVMVEIALSPLHRLGPGYVVAALRDVAAYPRVRQALQRTRYSEELAQLGRLAVDARDPQALLDQVPRVAAEALRCEFAVVLLLGRDRPDLGVASGVGLPTAATVGTRVPNRPDTLLGQMLARGQPVQIDDCTAEHRFELPPAFDPAGLRCVLAQPLSDRGRPVGALVVGAREPQRFGADERRFVESLANLLTSSLQRAQTEEALHHSQRLETVGQLTGGIAHDFNNLLTVIQGNLQVLEELPALADDGHGQQLVAAARRASRRAAELTGKLLAFSRRQVLQPSSVDVGAMLNSLADMLRRTLDQRIAIEVDAPARGPLVRADAGQLESALLNIAINARDAMPDGGTLRFACAACDALPDELLRELDPATAHDSPFVAITVADDGCGMSEQVKERAFEPFFTTKESGRGTGLGLSTVYGFVKQSSGAIAIDSAPGAGTTLRLYIPRAPRAVPPPDGPGDVPLPPGLKVLLVEDDAEVREVVRGFLQALGCEVADVASAEQALLQLDAASPFDLLLSDIALGAGMRGTQLAVEARRRRPGIAVLLMSGFSAELLDADRDAPGGWELLRKPYGRAELARAIARSMRAREG